ncbi:MAG: TetR family transcriptional regulator C-terminal domain-containing protein [Rhodobacteraceae bacterium]|jgi:AcrR family transcriptional regulator|uniref:TetR/AcrR family transcriptional regulator n=1 Tax=Albidovulum sp. TaxID=1872424 RepID=UPI001D999851|nr:TetR family transcriptional regulator C-terminal domain-containing protein [uncultured Defluviimonas sp.]MCB2124930.1 TetR family transcriptional regulator C-terminal domain-containing protein [Paracoccaceae bacterium]MCC0070917.1 TetR family transcriptional regulator C-terminal domain-containing protein [Paracoccaceae bacterium]
MAVPRRKFTREEPQARRADLIGAVLDLMAEAGPAETTVRAIAEAAGLSPGMIRHHFTSKEDLVNAAYEAHMARQIADSERALGPGSARDRLRRFVSASVTPPVVDPRAVSLWAAFLHMVRRDPAMRATHEATYLAYRDRLQGLIAAALAEAGRIAGRAELRRLSIACNAVIDGLWLEAGVLPEAFTTGEIEAIGLVSVGALLGLDLAEDRA